MDQSTICTSELEMLAVCRVLIGDNITESLFAEFPNTQEIATVLALLSSRDAVIEAVRLLCQAGAVWQVLHAAAKKYDTEALYDSVPEILSSEWVWGSEVIKVAAEWAFLNRRHNTYEWLVGAIPHITDQSVLEIVDKRYPRLSKKTTARL